MPEVDGSIRIVTKMDTATLKKQIADLDRHISRQTSELEKASAAANKLRTEYEAYVRAQAEAVKGDAAKKIDEENKKLKELKEAYNKAAIEKERLEKLSDTFKADGRELPAGLQDAIRANDKEIARIDAEVQQARANIAKAQGDIAGAGDIAANSDKAKAMADELAKADDKTRNLESALAESKNRMGELQNASQQMAASMSNVDTETQKTQRSVGGLTAYIKRLAKRMLLLYAFRRVFTYIRNAIMSMSGIGVVTSAFSEFNNKMKQAYENTPEIQAALAKLRGSLYTAFQPIYSAVVPALVTLINWLARGVQYIAAFFSALSGKKLSDSADGAKNLAKAVGGVGGAAKQANKQLAQFDKLNTLSENSGGGGGGGGGGATDFNTDAAEDKVALFEKIGERIRLVIERIKAAYYEFMAWWDTATPEQKAVVLAVALALLIPLLFTLLSWPKAMIIALALLIAVVETYYEEITGWLHGASEAIAKFFSDNIADFQNVIKQVKDWLTEHFGFLGTILGAIFTLVGGAVELIWNLVGDAVKLIIDTVTALVETIHAIATGDWTKAWEAWGTVVSDVWDGIKHIVVTVANTVVGIIADLWNAFAGWLNGIAELINAASSVIGLNWDLHVPTWDFKGFAVGGFPDVGSMFIAGEAGPELVGSFGGHNNAVINEAQLVGAFRRASSEQVALMQQQNALLSAILSKPNEFTFKPSSSAGRAFQQSLNLYNRAMG